MSYTQIELNQRKRENRTIKKKVLKFLEERKKFTSVDIGNSIKADGNSFIRNRRVSEWLRNNFTSVAYENGYAYNSTLIKVDSGKFPAFAYLYHHHSVDPTTYLDRDQFAFPPDQIIA